MRKLIVLANIKNNSGKTTLALNLASIFCSEFGLKAGVLEAGNLISDTKFMLDTKKNHAVDKPRDVSVYLPERESFYLFWDKSWERTIRLYQESLDVLIVDTEGFPEQPLLDMADTILIPAALNPYDIKYAGIFAEKLIDMRYPASVISVIVNKAENGLLGASDLQESFKNVKVIGVLPQNTAIAEAALKGEVYCSKNKKDGFYRALKNSASALLEGPSKPHMTIMEKIQTMAEETTERFPVQADVEARHPGTTQLKKQVCGLLYAGLDIRNLEKDALTHPDKKAKIFAEIKAEIRNILDRVDKSMTDRDEREAFVKALFDEVTGLGAVEELLRDPSISEIMVNRHDEIYVEKGGRLFKSEKRFTDDGNVMRAIERIVLPLGRRIDESMPYVDARLPDGSRVNAIIPPLSLDGPVLTIRKFSDKKLTAQDLVAYGSISREAVEYLREAVLKRKNILISGGTGSGKTTLLNVLSSFIPEDERIITVEDSAELKLSQEHVIRLESRPPNIEGRGAVTIRELVKNCLRMRPDRIVVGECRSGETLDMLQAMNTGHDGSMTTVHSNTPRDAVSRLEVMVLMSGVELPVKAIREQIKSAVNIIIQQARMKDGSRKITHITEITGMEGDTILMHDIFRYTGSGSAAESLLRADRV